MQARAPRASDPRRRRGPGPRRRPRARPRGRAQVIDTSGSAAIRFLFRSAVLRPQAGSGAVAVLGRVVRLSLRVPSAALIATAALTPVSRPRAVVPRHASALTHAPQLAPIRWRAVGLRGHQTAAPGARNVSTTRHGSLLSARFLLGKPGGGANAMGALRDGGGGHPPWVLAGSCAAGCVAAVLWSCRWRSRWRWAGCRAWSRPGPRRWRWASRRRRAYVKRAPTARLFMGRYRFNPAAFARAARSRASASVSARSCAARRVNSSSLAS
mgnify:CR=1 FL=1